MHQPFRGTQDHHGAGGATGDEQNPTIHHHEAKAEAPTSGVGHALAQT